MIDKEKECRHCGWHREWRYRRGKGHDCSKCRRRSNADRRKKRIKEDDEYRRRENQRKNAQSKRRITKENINKLMEFGEKYAEAYKADKEKGLIVDYRNYMPLIEKKELEKERNRKKYNRERANLLLKATNYQKERYLPIPGRFRRMVKLSGTLEGPWECSKCSYISEKYWIFDIDHILPVKDGGTNKLSNLQILCANCHKEKSFYESSSRGRRYQIVSFIDRCIKIS
jgi:5-methylcytosine-specific restriction endonuclease McrA